jgi:hypothetical protein
VSPRPHDSHELTPEQASRMAVTAVIADLKYWARTTAVDGRVGLNDLTRALDVLRLASIPEAEDAALDPAFAPPGPGPDRGIQAAVSRES